MAVRKGGGNFFNLLQKKGVPRKGRGGGVPSKKGGVPNLEETMLVKHWEKHHMINSF